MRMILPVSLLLTVFTYSSGLMAQDIRRVGSSQGQRYQPMYTPSYPGHAPSLNGGYDSRPPMPRPPHGGYPPHGGHPPPPPPPGINIVYQAPSYQSIHHETTTWVNGDPDVANISSSRYVLVTNWQDLGLPAPPNGMFWIYEDGRYMLVPNQ